MSRRIAALGSSGLAWASRATARARAAEGRGAAGRGDRDEGAEGLRRTAGGPAWWPTPFDARPAGARGLRRAGGGLSRGRPDAHVEGALEEIGVPVDTLRHRALVAGP